MDNGEDMPAMISIYPPEELFVAAVITLAAAGWSGWRRT